MKLNKKTYWGIGLTAVVVFGAVLFRGGAEVETIVVQPAAITKTVEDVGYVQPATDFNYQATQTARVVQVPVETGQPVRQGETLIVLENLDLAAQLTEARSQLGQASATASGAKSSLDRAQLELKDAQANLDRVQALWQAGAVTQAEYDQARLRVETGQRDVSEQQSRLETTRSQIAGINQLLEQLTAKQQQLVITSPVDGVVMSLPVKKEQVLQPGTPLVSVAAPGQLEIKADILSDDLAEIRTGQKAVVTAPVLGQKSLVGEVKMIYPQAEEKQSALGVIQRRVPVVITLVDADQLKPGYEVRVAIEVASRQDVLVVPREAVRTTKDGQKEVMAVVDKKVQRQPVKLGLSGRDTVEVTEGLTAGLSVVRDGSLDLAEGTRVKPMN